MLPNYNVRQVFSVQQENALENYLIQCAKMCYGLDTIETRRLAYDMAIYNKVDNIPPNWHAKKQAGKDWLYYFRKRHPALSLRRPEACSLARATSFNRHNVALFFNNLKTILNRYPHLCDGTRIYNLDETGVSTVQTPKRILAPKGVKQLNKATSAERGNLVTVCCIIQASGSAIPPVIVFPRVHFKEHMLVGAPAGSLGLASPSGWMNSELFIKVIEHFIKHTHSSKENPTLLLLDNHESHLSIGALNLAKANGIIILTIPPHCSNKLQPLDISVYKSFQSNYNSAIESWMLHHPGVPVTIYQVADFIGTAFERSMTPSNIGSGFRKAGIFPFDENIFTDEDFLCSAVTDRPLEESLPEVETGEPLPSETSQNETAVLLPTPSTSKDQPIETNIVTPESFRGLPKAAARKGTSKTNRRKGRSCIATDTPVKDEFERRAEERKAKTEKKTKVKRNVLPESSESSDISMHLDDTDDDVDDFSQPEERGSNEYPREGDFVLAKFPGKRGIVYYVGKVLKDKNKDLDYEVTYLRKYRSSKNKFVYPIEPDIALLSESDVELILPQPFQLGHTKRQNAAFVFPVNLNNYNVM